MLEEKPWKAWALQSRLGLLPALGWLLCHSPQPGWVCPSGRWRATRGRNCSVIAAVFPGGEYFNLGNACTAGEDLFVLTELLCPSMHNRYRRNRARDFCVLGRWYREAWVQHASFQNPDVELAFFPSRGPRQSSSAPSWLHSKRHRAVLHTGQGLCLLLLLESLQQLQESQP